MRIYSVWGVAVLLALCLCGVCGVENPAFPRRQSARQRLLRQKSVVTSPKSWQLPGAGALEGPTTPPASFTTIATANSIKDLALLLYTLADHVCKYKHPGVSVYIFCDQATADALDRVPYPLNLRLHLHAVLDKYGKANRQQMYKDKTWTDFQMEKANAIQYALQFETDTLFLDSDIQVLAPFQVPVRQNTADGLRYQIGLSPHLISEDRVKKYGFFNGGILWVADKAVPYAWKRFAKTSRYYDQAALEDLADNYRYFFFGEEINYSWWRDNDPDNRMLPTLDASGRLQVKGKPVVCIHYHFFASEVLAFRRLVRQLMLKSPVHQRFLRLVDYIDYDFDTDLLKLPHEPWPCMGLKIVSLSYGWTPLVLLNLALFMLMRHCRHRRSKSSLI